MENASSRLPLCNSVLEFHTLIVSRDGRDLSSTMSSLSAQFLSKVRMAMFSALERLGEIKRILSRDVRGLRSMCETRDQNLIVISKVMKGHPETKEK